MRTPRSDARYGEDRAGILREARKPNIHWWVGERAVKMDGERPERNQLSIARRLGAEVGEESSINPARVCAGEAAGSRAVIAGTVDAGVRPRPTVGQVVRERVLEGGRNLTTTLKPYSRKGRLVSQPRRAHISRTLRERTRAACHEAQGARWGWRRRSVVTAYTSDGVGGRSGREAKDVGREPVRGGRKRRPEHHAHAKDLFWRRQVSVAAEDSTYIAYAEGAWYQVRGVRRKEKGESGTQ